MSQRRGQALPPPPRISQGHRGRLERLLFAFTREQLALARFATLAVGVRPGEARPGDKRDRGSGEGIGGDAHDSDDSSGGATTLSPTAEERAAGMIAAANRRVCDLQAIIQLNRL